MSDTKNNYKATMDRLLTDLRKTCHAMIDQNYVSSSPISLMKEALNYIDQKYAEKNVSESADVGKKD
ncbi:MAG: hypothetical protein AB7I27_01970 [Bacteriovoracaceae bacterium]